MKKLIVSIILCLTLSIFTNFGFNKESKSPFVCVSSYSIQNGTTNSSNIINARIIAHWCDCGGPTPYATGDPTYDENLFITPGSQYDIDTNTFSSEATTTFVRFFLTTNTSFIEKKKSFMSMEFS